MISIIVIHKGVIAENILVTRRDYDEKFPYGIAEAAEMVFLEKIRSNFRHEIPTDVLVEALENGYYEEDNGVEVIISHPDVQYVHTP